MTHGQLDDLFRANAERGDFRPAPGEWEEMTALLEADERRERIGRWVSGAWGLLFLALIGFGVYGAMSHAPGWGSDEGTTAADATPTTERPVAGELSSDARAGTAPAVLEAGAFAKTDNDAPGASPQQQARDASAASLKTPTSPPSTGASHANEIGVLAQAAAVEGPLSVDGGGGEYRHAPTTELPPRNAPGVTTRPAPPVPLPRDESPRSSLAALPYPTVFAHHTVGELEIPPVGKVSSERSRWGLYGVVAAEATEVNMDSPLAYGYRVGPQVTYRVNDRLHVSGALLLGRRSYHAAYEQTTMPAALFVDDVMPSNTHGQSTVAELPLSLTYYPASRRGPRWYLSVGLNSYRLFRDEMTFSYREHRPGQIHNMRAPDPDFALASSLRLGGGLALDCFGDFPIEVGPYLQLPLQGTSYSEVSLYSAGLQLSVPLARR